jgi:hypothetical protein
VKWGWLFTDDFLPTQAKPCPLLWLPLLRLPLLRLPRLWLFYWWKACSQQSTGAKMGAKNTKRTYLKATGKYQENHWSMDR